MAVDVRVLDDDVRARRDERSVRAQLREHVPAVVLRVEDYQHARVAAHLLPDGVHDFGIYRDNWFVVPASVRPACNPATVASAV